MRTYFYLAFLLFVSTTFPTLSTAQDPLSNIPASLKEWIPWVKDEILNLNCIRNSKPSTEENYDCLWYGKGEVEVSNNGAKLNLSVLSLADKTELPLPSNQDQHISNLKVMKDQKEFFSFSLKKRESSTSIILPKGNFEISGEILWEEIPNNIPIPAEYGLLEIKSTLDKTLRITREPNSLKLESSDKSQTTDSLNLEVYRKIIDGSPLIVKTRLALSASGTTRIETLGTFLPKNSELIDIEGSLQTFIDQNGEIKLKITQGNHNLTFTSAIKQPVSAIEYSDLKKSSFWPSEEILIWQADQELRSVELTNVTSINSNQAHLPSDWASDSAYAVSSFQQIELNQKRRGEEKAGQNQIKLSRTIWPHLNDDGLSVLDSINATIKGTFRLNAKDGLSLGRVSSNSTPIPITLDPNNNLKGIELRNQNQTLEAVSELESSYEILAGGWDEVMDEINIDVNIPPSWKLLFTKGVTEAHGTWISNWTIFDVFILAILCIFTKNVLGTKHAVVYLLLSVIGRSEFMLPTVFFAYIVLLFAILKLTSEKTSKYIVLPIHYCILLSAVALVVQSLSFAKLQVIQFLHPHLESGTRYKTLVQNLLFVIAESPLVWILFLIGLAFSVFIIRWCFQGGSASNIVFRLFVGVIAISIGSTVLSGISVFIFSIGSSPRHISAKYDRARKQIEAPSRSPRYEVGSSFSDLKVPGVFSNIEEAPAKSSFSSRTVQAGPSRPSWQWKEAHLSIVGPINPEHKIKLFFIKTGTQRLLCIARLILTFLLLSLLAPSLTSFIKASNISNLKKGATTLALLFLTYPSLSHADTPSKDILNGLRNRIEQTRCLASTCSYIDQMHISIDKNSFQISLSVNSNGLSSIEVPGSVFDLIPTEVLINSSLSNIYRIENQNLSVKVGDGHSDVLIKGVLSDKNAISIRIPQAPLSLNISSNTWDVGKYDRNGQSSIVQISKLISNNTEKTTLPQESRALTDNWYVVERSLHFGDQIKSTGVITRIGSLSNASTLQLPLKKDEQLNVATLTSVSGKIIVNFPAGVNKIYFTTSFLSKDLTELSAESEGSISEIWDIACEDYTSCQFSGDLTPNRRIDPSGNNVYRFIPFPGETLSVNRSILKSVLGTSISVEKINHSITWGETTLSGKLDISLLTTGQSNFLANFPDKNISIESVRINGSIDSRPFKNGEVNLLLEPNSKSIEIDYKIPEFKPSVSSSVPSFNLNSQAGNIFTTVSTGSPRWLIWLDGSSWGPSVLIWGKLIGTLFIILVLNRLSFLLNTLPQNILLSVVLSLMPSIILPIPLLWLALLKDTILRRYIQGAVSKLFYTVALSLLAVVSVGVFYQVIKLGLLGDPPLLISGNSSSLLNLVWYTDICRGADNACSLPTPWILSLPLEYWRGLTLLISVLLSVLTIGLIKETALVVKGSDELEKVEEPTS